MIPFGILASLWACGESALVHGQVVDALTDRPIAPAEGRGLEVVATAKDTGVRPTCAKIVAPVDADGRFTLSGLCAGGYTLRLSDASLWLPEGDALADPPPGDVTLTAWRAPAKDDYGLYELTNGQLVGLTPAARAKENALLGKTDTVRYPDVMPDPLPSIEPGEWLVLAGADYVAKGFEPVLPADAHRFGDPKAPLERSPWYYVGVRFVSDAEVEKVTATVDASKVRTVENDGRTVKYVPHDALPEGVYAVDDTQRRMYVVKFGAAPVPSLPAGETAQK